MLRLVADGYSSAKIGDLLHLSPKTVDSYRSRLMQKLQITQLARLIKFANHSSGCPAMPTGRI